MNKFIYELIGTAILVLLGNGVVATVLLNKSKGKDSGWLTITTGWAFAVVIGAYFAGAVSGAHLNPAVTIGMLAIGNIALKDAVLYIIAQFIGAIIGQLLVVLTYKKHYDETTDKGLILATFSTGPAIRDTFWNIVSEAIGTFMLVFGILALVKADLGNITILLIGILVFAIGLSLGGATGYAINPARDLGPRILHAILPLKNKGDSDWAYALVPVIGPIIGGILGALVFSLL